MRDSLKIYFVLVLVVFSFIGCGSNITPDTNQVVQIKNKDFSSQSVLHDAVRANDLEQVEFLIKQNVQLGLKDKYGYTPLHIAVRVGNYEIVKFLIENKSNVNTTDVYGDTPLLDATRNNDTNISKLLICNGANRNVFDSNNVSTLNYSTKNNNRYISELLVSEDLTSYCQEESNELINEEIIPNEVEALGDDNLNYSINDLNKLNSSKPIICGKITSNDIEKMEMNLISSGKINFGPYTVTIDNTQNSWCSEVSDELQSGTYTLSMNAFDDKKRSRNIEEQFYLETSSELYEALRAEFINDFESWNAELDSQTLSFRLKNTNLLFEAAQKDLKSSFKDMLDDFIPRYIDILLYYKDEIQNISIEGHSSSEYSFGQTKEEKFELNRALSQKRADQVLRYMKDSQDKLISDNLVWIITTFQAVGKSSQNLIYKENGEEDQERSRRIEFVINLKKK